MEDDQTPLRFLSRPERIALGGLVLRLCSTGNPRFQRALKETGAKATVRMACVNALRLYAGVLFVLGTLLRLGHLAVPATAVYSLAVACMAWSFWCLYTVVGPERAFRRASATEQRPI